MLIKNNNNLAFVVILALSLCLLAPINSFAQEEWQQIASNSQDINETGMQVLLGWSILNISSGTYGFFKTEGSRQYFHQMNGIWNLVNAGIAIGALSGMQNETMGSLQEAYKSGQNMEKILLANAGLDVGYIAAGGFLLERGKRKNAERFRGYGRSVMIQGGFLLALDVVLFALNQQQNQELYKILEQVNVSSHGVGVNIPF